MSSLVLKYFIIIFILIPSCFYYAYNQSIYGDIKNYYEIYNSLNVEPYPFGMEFMLPIIMKLFSSWGFTYYDFTFVRLLLWGLIIILWTQRLNERRVIFFMLFIVSFCVPPFFNSMIFLSRQSLSLQFCFLAMLIAFRPVKLFFIIGMIFSHFASIIWLLPMTGIGVGLVNTRKFISLIFIILIINVTLKADLASDVIYLLSSDIIPVPLFIKDILATKLGFYLYDQTIIVSALSEVSIAFILFTLIILFFSIPFTNKGFDEKITCIYLISAMLLVLFYNNDVMANRLGMVAYFMVIPFLVYFFIKAISCKVPNNAN